MDTMELPLDRTEIEVVLKDAKGGEEKRWILRELGGRERNKYLNTTRGRLQITNGQASGVKNFDGMQSDLLTESLFDEAGNAVTKDAIEALPAKTQHALFLKAREISGLEQDAKDGDSKNG